MKALYVHACISMVRALHEQVISGRSQTNWQFQHATRDIDFCCATRTKSDRQSPFVLSYEDSPYTQDHCHIRVTCRLGKTLKERHSRKST